MRYIIYARKSSESEDRQVQSIDDQLAALSGLATQRCLQVVEVLTESKSAKEPNNRPAFTRMLALIRERKGDAVLCWAVNRLSRNPEESGVLMGMLQRGEIQAIQTVDREYRPEDNVLLLAFESGVANQFTIDLRKNVIRGMESKISKGWFPHRAPEGYRNNLEDNTIETDRDRFVLLRRAWDMMLTGAYTVPQVRRELLGWGFTTKKSRRRGGRPISQSAVYAMFHNPFYSGSFRHRGGTVSGVHEPMVTVEEFERVQAILGRPGHPQPQRHEFAFTGLMHCATCGCVVTAEERVKHYRGTGRTAVYRYYHCTGSRGCRKRSVPEAFIEDRIRTALADIRIDPDVAAWAREALHKWSQREHPRNGQIKAVRGRTLDDLERRADRLFEMRSDEEIGRDEYLVRKKAIDDEIAALRRAEADEASQTTRTVQAVVNGLEFCESAFDRFTGGAVREKREVAALLATDYLLTLETVEIRLHPVVAAIAAFEPMTMRSTSAKKAPIEGMIPAWSAMLESIRSMMDVDSQPN